MPRAANCSSSSSRPPGWSSDWNTTTEVLSAPVGGGGAVGRDTSTNRVTADGLSPTPSTSDVEPVAVGRHPGAQGGVVAGVGLAGRVEARGRRGGRQPRDVDGVRQVRAEPVPALRLRVRVGREAADVLEPGAGPGGQHELHGDERLAHDDDVLADAERVEGGADPALDRVLDRHHRGGDLALADGGQRGVDARVRQPLAGLRGAHLAAAPPR